MTSSSKPPHAFPSPYRKLSEQELDGELLDQTPSSLTTPRRSYVICSTQRSGSWLLCRQLINAGLGVPSEYFHAEHIAALCRRWRLATQNSDAYCDALLARRTTPNAVWGTKLQWAHYVSQRRVIEGRLLAQALPIILYRSDVLAQAVSLHISLVTGIWGFDGIKLTEGVSGVRLGERGHVDYCAHAIRQQNTLWRDLFAERGVEPLLIGYEDFARNQTATLRALAERLGLEATAYQLPPPEPRENVFPAEIEQTRQELLASLKARSRQ